MPVFLGLKRLKGGRPIPGGVSGCLLAVAFATLAPILLFSGLLSFPWPFKTVVGHCDIAELGTLEVGRQHDGDISHNFYYRIDRSGKAKPEWIRFGWNINGGGKCISASSADGRFHCLASNEEIHLDRYPGEGEFPLMVIFDRETGVVWPGKRSADHPEIHWLNAWTLLKKANPTLPDPTI